MATVGSARVLYLPAARSAELRAAGRYLGSECFPRGHQAPITVEMTVCSRPPLIANGSRRPVQTGCPERLTLGGGIAECTTWHAGNADERAITPTRAALSPRRRTPALARWLSSLVQLQGYGHDFRAWATSQKLEDFLKMVEERWHDPQEAQRATDEILTLHTRQFKSVREATDAVERLICVPGVRYDPQGRVQRLSRPVESTCANKQRMVVNDYLQDVECSFPYAGGDLRHRVSFLVSDELPMDMLLGMYYLSVAQPQFDWDRKVVKHTLPGGGTSRLHKFKASSLIDSHGYMCAAAFYNYYKQHREEGMYLVYVSAAGEPVKMPPEIEGVVAKYPDLFEEPTGVVDREVVHAIEIIPGSSIPKGRIYRMFPAELDEFRRQLKELVKKGWIRPSVSPYGSPVLFIPKKEEGTLRMCIDYRGLNAIIVKNREPLPRIDDLLDKVQGCRYFNKIDLKSGYHQIAIRPEDQPKTAFQTRYGLYEFVVMPFGLCNAPGTFQHAMNRIFHDYLDKFVIVYLDDILIFSKTVEEHVAHLDKVLSLLQQHKFKINGEKCEFGRTRVLYLGHEISAEGLKPDNAKVANIRDWPRPQSVTEIGSFLGMTDYYRTFVKNYSIVASPLTDLTRLDTPWEWTDKCEAAFRHLKHSLTHYEVLKLPDLDKPFIVTTDAIQYGIGAVLAQQEGPKLRPVEYMSKNMSSQKLPKSTYEKELYAVYKALTHWRHYLLGRFFILRTDHQTLKWMRTQPVLSDALKRWIEVIEQYDFDPQYLKGEYNKVADALSRRLDFSGALITEFSLTDNVTQSLVEAYHEDQFMSEIIRKLEAKDKKTSAEFELVNGLLFLEKAGNKRLCVPNSESLRSLFLGESHDATGHFGYKKTTTNLLQRFWWPTMMRDAQLYVETCQVCQRDKPRTQAPLGLLKPLPIPERAGESLSMDFMDTLVTSKSGMRQIFVIVDRFSKYARLIAMPETAKTEYVIRLFKENWVRDFGLPKSIVSDRDVRFTSELWKAAAAKQGTQLQMTSGNHPEANGQAEQMNRAVQHLLRHYIKPNQVDWDEKFALVASLYNNAVHSATGAVNSIRRDICRRRGRREAAIAQAMMDVQSSPGVWDAPFLLTNTIVAGVLPKETPRWTTSTPRSQSTWGRNFNGGKDRASNVVELSWKGSKLTTVAAASANNSPASDINTKRSDKLDIPPPGCSRIKVDISRPLGLVLRDDPSGNIWVDEVVPDGNAARTGLVDVGDQLIATSAVVYTMIEDYNGVKVRKGMEVVRLNVRGEKFDTVMAAIGTHPGHMKVTLELQKCKPTVNGAPRMN
ncbi:hypothetical protein CBR_g40347 [Chara braunii]|uniref:Reverse transcriptase n=1 Tax=Chara braunii TaxID=69332 RepID=A0A388LTN5_CHABU|nr:hypothetical protein CBR_g40347 [Chara braunii]|eukprot:GBG85619.1 hypothetical protein CBR_g40347 [Chara braunii]